MRDKIQMQVALFVCLMHFGLVHTTSQSPSNLIASDMWAISTVSRGSKKTLRKTILMVSDFLIKIQLSPSVISNKNPTFMMLIPASHTHPPQWMIVASEKIKVLINYYQPLINNLSNVQHNICLQNNFKKLVVMRIFNTFYHYTRLNKYIKFNPHLNRVLKACDII